jgi:hypothetical protein
VALRHDLSSPATTIGELGFLRWTREDIIQPVHILGTAIQSWTPKHDKALGRILRYLRGTNTVRRRYSRHSDFRLDYAWADCSFGNELHHGTLGRAKSRSGVLLTVNGAVLLAISTRTTCTPLSTAEGEAHALALCVRNLIPYRYTIAALRGAPDTGPPTVVYDDNHAVILTLRRRVVTGRMRHVRVALSFCLHAVETGHIVVRFCPSAEQLADFLTKSLGKYVFAAMMSRLRALPLASSHL